MNRTSLVFRVVVGFLLPLAGSALARVPVGAAFLSEPMSVRQMGMGNISMGGGPDVLRSWWNPALLDRQGLLCEVAVNGASEISDEIRTVGVGVGLKLSPAVHVGVLLGGRDFSTPEVNAAGDYAGNDLGRRGYAGGVVTSLRTGWLVSGLSVKGVSDEVDGDSVACVAADAGLAFVISGIEAGVSLRNFGSQPRPGESLPMELCAGTASRLMAAGLLAGTRVGAEYSITRGREGRLGIGLEFRPVSSFGLRAGLAGVAAGDHAVTFGFSGRFGRVVVDYALAARDIGPSHRASVSVSLGEASGAETAPPKAPPKPETP